MAFFSFWLGACIASFLNVVIWRVPRGENVPNLAADADVEAYRAAFGNLVGAFYWNGRRPKAVVRGVFWPNAAKDVAMAQVAAEYGIPFVKADVAEEPGMRATGLFSHRGVANHPGDTGMRRIADLILSGFFDGLKAAEASLPLCPHDHLD